MAAVMILHSNFNQGKLFALKIILITFILNAPGGGVCVCVGGGGSLFRVAVALKCFHLIFIRKIIKCTGPLIVQETRTVKDPSCSKELHASTCIKQSSISATCTCNVHGMSAKLSTETRWTITNNPFHKLLICWKKHIVHYT